MTAGGIFAFLMSRDNVSLSLFTAAGDTPAIAAASTFLTLAAPVIMVLFGRTLRQRQSSGLKER